MNNKQNYWSMKDSEIRQLCLDRGIQFQEFDRKLLIEALQRQDEIGASDTVMVDSGNGIKKAELEELPSTVVIFHNTGRNDTPYVPVGHNGKAWYLPKDKELRVPNFLLDSCIKDAVEEWEEPIYHSNGVVTWETRKVQRFPYSIVRQD